MDSFHQMPPDTPQKAAGERSRFEIASIVVPVLLSVVLAGIVLFQMKAIAQSDTAIATQKKQIADLTAQLAEVRGVAASEARTMAGDGTKTILADTTAIGGAQTVQNLLTQNSAARQYGTTLLGRAWILPRKIVPQSTDGSLGFQYAYLYPDGKVEGWFVPERAP